MQPIAQRLDSDSSCTVIAGTGPSLPVTSPGTIRPQAPMLLLAQEEGDAKPPKASEGGGASFCGQSESRLNPTKFKEQGNKCTVWWKELQTRVSKGMDLGREEELGLTT